MQCCSPQTSPCDRCPVNKHAPWDSSELSALLWRHSYGFGCTQDPLADGPTIHAAATRALANGTTLDEVHASAASAGNCSRDLRFLLNCTCAPGRSGASVGAAYLECPLESILPPWEHIADVTLASTVCNVASALLLGTVLYLFDFYLLCTVRPRNVACKVRVLSLFHAPNLCRGTLRCSCFHSSDFATDC